MVCMVRSTALLRCPRLGELQDYFTVFLKAQQADSFSLPGGALGSCRPSHPHYRIKEKKNDTRSLLPETVRTCTFHTAPTIVGLAGKRSWYSYSRRGCVMGWTAMYNGRHCQSFPIPSFFGWKKDFAQGTEGYRRLTTLPNYPFILCRRPREFFFWWWTPKPTSFPLRSIGYYPEQPWVPWKGCPLETRQKGNRNAIPHSPLIVHRGSWLLCHFYYDSVMYSMSDEHMTTVM